jgi:hypothetical protein
MDESPILYTFLCVCHDIWEIHHYILNIKVNLLTVIQEVLF